MEPGMRIYRSQTPATWGENTRSDTVGKGDNLCEEKRLERALALIAPLLYHGMGTLHHCTEILPHYPEALKCYPGLNFSTFPSIRVNTPLLIRIITLEGILARAVHFHAEGRATLVLGCLET